VRLPLNACCLAGLVLAATAAAPAAAQKTAAIGAPDIAPSAAPQIQMQGPRISTVSVNWDAVRGALYAITPLGSAKNALTRLNGATQRFFPDIGASPVPVLLPFDTASFLTDDAAGAATDKSKYMSGYSAANFFFLAGPSGYDASLTLLPEGKPDANVNWHRRVDVQITASLVIYDLGGPVLPQGTPVPDLNDRFPGIRRLTLEEHLRYNFVRFGVPYAVTVMCYSARCRDEEKIGAAFLKALAIVGGEPQPAASAQAAQASAEIAPRPIERPKDVSPDFTFYAPGDILPGTGMHGAPGRSDATVFADIRFPMAQAPAYVNSQTFGNWGDCDFTGRVALGGRGKDATYRCRVNSIPLVRDEAKNYAYPWRDNFCEHRYFAVSQCPAGLGHQGEDIRPGSCQERDSESERCEPYRDGIVAVRDGTVLRAPGDEALYLVVNAPGEHIRFRYLHMNPTLLDDAGMLSGRALKEGEMIGTADDYEGHQGGTSYHLHFDVQVPTRDGWVFVNPYMTLVSSYERLIGARGNVVDDTMLARTPSVDNTTQIGGTHTATAEEKTGEERTAPAERHTVRLAKGHRHRRRRAVVAARAERQERTHPVRSTGRVVSHESDRTWHHAGDLHARHAHRAARHGRA
jgi:hypothetical protein